MKLKVHSWSARTTVVQKMAERILLWLARAGAMGRAHPADGAPAKSAPLCYSSSETLRWISLPAPLIIGLPN